MTANPKYRSVFKRMETDAEFSARVIPSQVQYVIEWVSPRNKGERYDDYLRRIRRTGESATDLELRRLYGESVRVDSLTGERLDNVVWQAYQKQRRIIDDVK